jgi:6-phosphogluconolactonase
MMIESYPSHAALAEAAAEAIAARIAQSNEEHLHATLVATGGRMPGLVYDRLAQTPLEWGRVVVTLSDERVVDETSPDSNARLVRERLMVDEAAVARFLPLTEDAEDALWAQSPFDAVMLGMGEDGHIAALIPGSPLVPDAMDPDDDRWVVSMPAGHGSPPLPRISMTFAALLQSRAIFLLIAGDKKREVLEGAGLPVHALLAQDRVPVRIFWCPEI